MKQSPDEIMRAYEQAYEAANGKRVQIDYFRGWYAIYTGGNFQVKHRGKEVQAMTKRFAQRIQEQTA